MQAEAAAKIDRGLGNAVEEDTSQAEELSMTDFRPTAGRIRRPGTGCITEINNHLFSSDVEQIIRRELAKLPKLTREIFVDSRFRFLSHKEISEKYDLPVRRVRWEITKTLDVLKVALKDYMPAYIVLAYFVGDKLD